MERGRAAQPSKAQLEVLLDYLERNPGLAKGFPRVFSAREASRRSWEVLTLRLNSLEGCTKTSQQWSKYWTDKRNIVKKKAALQIRALNGTSGGPQVVETAAMPNPLQTPNTSSLEVGPRIKEILPPPTSPISLPPSPTPQPETAAGSIENPSSLAFGVDIFSASPSPFQASQPNPANSQSTSSQLGGDTIRVLPVVSPPREATSPSGEHHSHNARRRLTSGRRYSQFSKRLLALEEERIELDRQRLDIERQRLQAERERLEAERERTQAYRERTELYRQQLHFERHRCAPEKMELERNHLA